jgi:hypothetical protein
MRKDVREFIRRLEAVGLTLESTPGNTASSARESHSAKPTGCRSHRRSHRARSDGAERRSSSCASSASTCSKNGREMPKPADLSVTGLDGDTFPPRRCVSSEMCSALGDRRVATPRTTDRPERPRAQRSSVGVGSTRGRRQPGRLTASQPTAPLAPRPDCSRAVPAAAKPRRHSTTGGQSFPGGTAGSADRSQPRAAPCCLARTTPVLPDASRRKPVVAGPSAMKCLSSG